MSKVRTGVLVEKQCFLWGLVDSLAVEMEYKICSKQPTNQTKPNRTEPNQTEPNQPTNQQTWKKNQKNQKQTDKQKYLQQQKKIERLLSR